METSSKSNYEKMLSGEFYHPDAQLAELAIQCSQGLLYINSLPARNPERDAFLKNFFGAIGENVTIKGNFNCDYGRHIFIGDGCILNCNVTILDTARVTLGNNVFIAPGVVITAATHPLDAEARIARNFIGHAITIEDNVWIGANAVILQGVTIGKNAVVAAGSVVNRDVPANCLVGGMPAKVIKEL